jgi:phosphatidylglycerol:prolipoprotein diacylglycerol transferase
MYPELFKFGPITVYSYGLMAAIGFLLAGYLLERELARVGENKELAGSIIISAIIGGIVGSKIYFLLENPQLLRNDFFGSVFSGAGLVWYGGLIGGLLSVVWWIRRKGLPFLLVADLMGPLLLLGQAMGRIGCFLSGDGCYGPPSDVPWAMSFPNGVVPTTQRVHPTPLYDAFLLLLLFALLWFLRKKNFRPGTIFGLFGVFMGVERFFTEFYRTNPKDVLGFLSQAQFISIFLVLGGVSLIIYVNKFKKYPEMPAVKEKKADTGKNVKNKK